MQILFKLILRCLPLSHGSICVQPIFSICDWLKWIWIDMVIPSICDCNAHMRQWAKLEKQIDFMPLNFLHIGMVTVDLKWYGILFIGSTRSWNQKVHLCTSWGQIIVYVCGSYNRSSQLLISRDVYDCPKQVGTQTPTSYTME